MCESRTCDTCLKATPEHLYHFKDCEFEERGEHTELLCWVSKKNTKIKSCDEFCQLFRWHKCMTERKDGLCDQPNRFDNALNEWGDDPES